MIEDLDDILYCFVTGGIKPVKRNKRYGLTDDDIEYHTHSNAPDEYICWQGTQIPKWMQ